MKPDNLSQWFEASDNHYHTLSSSCCHSSKYHYNNINTDAPVEMSVGHFFVFVCGVGWGAQNTN